MIQHDACLLSKPQLGACSAMVIVLLSNPMKPAPDDYKITKQLPSPPGPSP